jgi:hypothetical protein
MNTWEDVHAGDIVLGHDNARYGVAEIEHGSPGGPRITLRRGGYRTTAQPPPRTPITILGRADVDDEANAYANLEAAGLRPEIMKETHA